jgi:cytoskeleton protein RodZ
MGTLGQYLRSAREARGIDLRDAAQQTRIGLTYLKALEAEDFSRLPGEVFVKGFLKNYGKFLCLDEFEVMRRFGELSPPKSAPGAATSTAPAVAQSEKKTPRSATIEPFLWGTGVVIALALILSVFTSLPERHQQDLNGTITQTSIGQPETAPVPVTQSEKLYLKVVALENTWLLVRTDNSPQKKALLQKDESLIWSANERFLLSYGSAKALKLTLNGRELVVNEPENAVVRDLPIIASGIVNRNIKPKRVRKPKPKEIPTTVPQAPQAEVPRELMGPPAPVQPEPF